MLRPIGVCTAALWIASGAGAAGRAHAQAGEPAGEADRAGDASAASGAGDWRARVELSGFFGAHVFSGDSSLGEVGAATIASSVALGPRITYYVSDHVAVEGELSAALSSSRGGFADVNVGVLSPRVQARIAPRAIAGWLPFATAGVGAPISLSGNAAVIDNDISLEAFAGGGVMLIRDRTWNLRVDARVAAVPARGAGLVTAEVEFGLGLYRSLGGGGADRGRARQPADADVDSDGDGVVDADDRCPRRPEDIDGYQDDDGCPDIDNDLDQVLDIADSCPLRPESHNGFQDDDGCPDAVPREVLRIVGRVRGLSFDAGSARIGGRGQRALRRVAAVMNKHESVRVTVIGYTDAREADDAGEALSLQRARAVRDYLAGRGVRAWRVKVAGAGAESPAASNRSRRGRRANRRVEIELRVYVVKQAPIELPR